MPKRLWAWVFMAAMLATPVFALTTKSIDQGLTAAEVAAAVSGPGATISNVRITGATVSIGTFAEGGLGISNGIILSSGNIADAAGPNDSSGAGVDLGGLGDARRAERMAHRDRAAVDVNLACVEVERLAKAQHNGGESLVDLEQVDVA